ncbi:YbaK/EbsC family protein [Demequina sp. SYSU T00039]|uniref:YbaK/EbsC family protein n=1 Tax=Demequina lignilytica TaxID=3051663 RepID=A0AAW7M7P6_9MICO|nr:MULTISPECIES: YbaK/EbsC family protein [unclassified Demequina]MDN4477017.1 YbaK/EbsC family protein [Demequina sp. SYSU T00039-1]MDN4487190.1 YbaK/EbsC family protein [Demequina sp. SYSU T00039]
MHPSSAKILDLLTAAGLHSRVRTLADSARTAAEAAAALDCEVGAIASSLVFLADGEPILVLTSGSHRVDTDLLARQIGARAITRADAARVREATGQPIGGVAPVGHPAPVTTYIDVELKKHGELWAAAGTPHSVFEIAYDDLRRIANATEVTVEEHA